MPFRYVPVFVLAHYVLPKFAANGQRLVVVSRRLDFSGARQSGQRVVPFAHREPGRGHRLVLPYVRSERMTQPSLPRRPRAGGFRPAVRFLYPRFTDW